MRRTTLTTTPRRQPWSLDRAHMPPPQALVTGEQQVRVSEVSYTILDLCTSTAGDVDNYTPFYTKPISHRGSKLTTSTIFRISSRSLPKFNRLFSGPQSIYVPNFVKIHFYFYRQHWCHDKGVGPPKLKFLLRFDRNVEYKRPAGAYPLRDFHQICRVCTSFQDASGVKIWLDLLKGLWSYGFFKLRGSGFPQIFSAP